MSVSQLLNRDCTVISRSFSGGEDAYGNEVPEEALVSTVCELQPRARERAQGERNDQGEVSDDLYTAFFAPDEDLTTADAIVVDGFTYELVGSPWVARNPRSQVTTHIEVTVRRTAGAEDVS